MATVSLTIPTRGRPDLLRRALSSYLGNAAAHGHEVTATVVDDQIGQSSSLDIQPHHRLIDRERRQRVSLSIARALDVREEVTSFGLLGQDIGLPTTGAARNTALLATIGSVVVSVDDDTECVLKRPCRSLPSNRRSAHLQEPEAVWFSDIDSDRLCPDFETADEDFVGRLVQTIGSTPTSLGVPSFGPNISADSLGHPILVTVAGSYGDSGMECAPHLLLEPDSFERMAATSLAYAHARTATTLVRMAPSLEVSAAPTLMTLACALDNRVGLPPFCPVGRNQDGMYGALLQWIFAPAPIAHVPLAVRHGGARQTSPWGEKIWQSIVPNRLSDIFESALRWLAPRPLGGSLFDRFTHVGRRLEIVGRLSDDAFADLACESIKTRVKVRRDLIASRLSRREWLPPRLQNDLMLAFSRLEVAWKHPEKELRPLATLNKWRSVIGEYGELLAAWPDIRMLAQREDVWRVHERPAISHNRRVTGGNGLRPRFECPFCGGTFPRFLPFGHTAAVLQDLRVLGGGYRTNARCPQCKSLDRERLVFLYLLRRTRIFNRPSRILHFAPEFCLGRLLSSLPMTHHIAADLVKGRAVYQMDICNIPLADQSIDVVICNHVLEHVTDDISALAELRRVLRPLGFAIVQVPIATSLSVTVEEPPSQANPLARDEHFGQTDHVRIYGRDYVSRLRAAGFACITFTAHTDLGEDTVRRFALIPGEVLHVLYHAPVHGGSVSRACTHVSTDGMAHDQGTRHRKHAYQPGRDGRT